MKNVKLLVVLGSEEGLKHVQTEFPDLEARIYVVFIGKGLIDVSSKIWAAAVDPHLTDEGLISPGLGDTVFVLDCVVICPLISFTREIVSSIRFDRSMVIPWYVWENGEVVIGTC